MKREIARQSRTGGHRVRPDTALPNGEGASQSLANIPVMTHVDGRDDTRRSDVPSSVEGIRLAASLNMSIVVQADERGRLTLRHTPDGASHDVDLAPRTVESL